MSDALHSEQINDLAAALALAQAEIVPAAKDRENPYFKSKYSTLESVWDVARAPLTKNGLSVVQLPRILDDKSLALDTFLLHKSGQWMRGRYLINPVKPDPQGIGSAYSYARRYSLSAMVGIVSDEDDDGNAASRAESIPANGKKHTASSGVPASGAKAQHAAPAGEAQVRTGAGAPPAAVLNEKQRETVEAFRADYFEAKTLDALNAIAAEIKKEPDAVKAALLPVHNAAKARIKAANGAGAQA